MNIDLLTIVAHDRYFTKIDLLTDEEANKLPEEILICKVPKKFN